MSATKETLAQAAAYRLMAAACAGQGGLWNRQERLHDVAASQAAARAAAAPLLEVCGGCPIVLECATWAIVDEYTGIAAGAAWVKGVEKPVHWVRRHPPKKLAS